MASSQRIAAAGLRPLPDYALLTKIAGVRILQHMLNYSPPKEDVKLQPANLQELSRRLKVLAEPSRLRLLDLIIQGVQCNCELGPELGMAPNLISHHLSVLREIGLVNAERDRVDSRWVYYSVNRDAFKKLNVAFGAFFDPDRIQPRRLTCGPQASVCLPEALSRKSQATSKEKI